MWKWFKDIFSRPASGGVIPFTPAEVARLFEIEADSLQNIPSTFDIIAKRERQFLEKVIKPWIEKMGYDVEIKP